MHFDSSGFALLASFVSVLRVAFVNLDYSKFVHFARCQNLAISPIVLGHICGMVTFAARHENCTRLYIKLFF